MEARRKEQECSDPVGSEDSESEDPGVGGVGSLLSRVDSLSSVWPCVLLAQQAVL